MLKKSLISLMLVGAALFMSCRNPAFAPITEPTGGDPGGEAEVVSVYTFIEELSSSLKSSSGLPESDISIIVNGAKTAVGDDTTYIKGFIDDIVDGAVSAVGSVETPLNSRQRIDLIDIVIESVMKSINRHKSEAMAESARAIDPYAATMDQVLAQIAAAAIRNLSTAGVPAADIDDAAQGAVYSLVSSLDDGGVQVDDIPSAMQVITQAAVENITSNDTSSITITYAVQSITSAAVSAIDDIEVDGFDDSLVSDVVGGITAGATEAIDVIADDFATENSTGTVEAVSALASTITETAIGEAAALSSVIVDVVEVTESVTEEAIEAISEIDTIDTSSGLGDASSVISSITQTAVATAVNQGVVEADAQVAVVESASDGAQAISNDYTAEVLDDVIVVDSSGNTVADSGDSTLTDAIDSGIAQAENEPPVADAGDHRSIDILETTVLDGSNSGDSNDSIVSWLWWVASAPDGSTVVISPDNVAVTDFTPDIAGLYTIGLEVTDTYGESDTNFLQIAVAIETYEGLNIYERISYVRELRDDGNLETALNEINKVFTFYSQTNSWSEAYLVQGDLLWDLGRHNEAVASYNNVRSMNIDRDHFGDATRALGWLYQWFLGDGVNLDTAQAFFNELLTDARFAGSRYTGDAKHGLGFNYMRRDEYATARTYLNDALVDPDISNNEIYWSQFHLGESYLWESDDSATAFSYWDVILANPGTYCLNDNSETDYWKIRNIYTTKANIYRNNDDTVNAMAQYQSVLDYVGMPDDLKAWPTRELGDYHRDLGDQLRDSGDDSGAIAEFDLAEPYYEDAWTFGGGSEDSAWAYVSMNWMYRHWMEMLSDGAERDSVISKFLSACAQVLASDHDRPKIGTYINRGGYYQWIVEPGEYDNARSDFEQALNIAESGNYRDAVWARYELANHYRDRGWRFRDETGVPWESYFNTAINHFDMVTVANYPEYENWMEQFFSRALQDAALCYVGLKNYDHAITLLQPLVNDDVNYSQQDRAWFQFEIGSAYREKGHDSHNDANFFGAISDFSDAISAFEAVIPLASGTDDEQRLTDESNLRIGEAYRQIAHVYEDMDDETNTDSNFTSAIGFYNLVSDAEYWMYYDALRDKAFCQLGIDDFQGAIDTFQFIIDNVASNQDDINEMEFEIADAYRDLYNQTLSYTDYTAGIAAYDDVLAISGLSAETQHSAYRGKGRLIRDYAFNTYWHQGQPGTEFESLMNDAITAFSGAAAVPDEYDWWADDISEAYQEMGHSYKDLNMNYHEYMRDDPAFDIAVPRGYLINALGAFENAMDTDVLGNIHEDTYNDAKMEVGWTNFEIAYTYDFSTDFASASSNIVDGMNLGFEVLADNDADRDQQANVMVGFGDVNVDARGNSVELAGGTYNFSLANAVVFYTSTIDNYSDLENGYYAAKSQYGMGRANRQDGFDLESSPDLPGAVTAYSLAITQFDLVETNYSSLPDWHQWVIQNAQYECVDTLFDLARVQEANGDIAGAITSLQDVVTRGLDGGTFRVDEANNEISRIQSENP